jgi:hypothetical protein
VSRLRELGAALRCLTRLDWSYVHFKAALGLLWFIPLTQVEYLQRETAIWFIAVWGLVTVAGFVTSLCGLVMSAQRDETRRSGFRVELVGLWLIMAAPGVYGLIQVGLIVNGQNRWLALAFAYIICSALVPRIIMIKQAAKSRTVIYRYLQEAEDD